MSAALVVALHGRSLILASLGERLERHHGIRVVALDAGETGEGLALVEADVLLVDLGATGTAAALALAAARPDMMLVGVDPSGARLLVLSGAEARAFTSEELVGLIDRRAKRVASPA